MAIGKTATKTVIVNNKPTSTTSKTVELIVVNSQLTADNNDLNPGVNSKDRGNN